MTRIDQLPDDPKILKRWIVEREQRFVAEVEQRLAEREQEFQTLIARIKDEATRQLEAQRQRMEAEHRAVVAAILRRYYGPHSERFDPRQLLLFGQLVDQVPLDRNGIEEESGQRLTTRRVKNRDPHGRGELPDHLPRVAIAHDLTEAEKPCPCCGELRLRIGQDVSEQLEYLPASLQVLQHIRGKYACAKCERDGYNPNIVAAPRPPQPIEKGLPGPGLLAYVVVSKLGDHLPLYRLEKIFARQQVHIARSTMCAWMQAAGQLASPLVGLMKQRVKQSRTIHTDDTTVPIQAPRDKRNAGRVGSGPTSAIPITRTRFTNTRRTGRGPARRTGWPAGVDTYKRTPTVATTEFMRTAA